MSYDDHFWVPTVNRSFVHNDLYILNIAADTIQVYRIAAAAEEAIWFEMEIIEFNQLLVRHPTLKDGTTNDLSSWTSSALAEMAMDKI